MKKPLWKNLALYPLRGMARVDWSRRCAIHQFLFHIFFFLNTSNGGMKCPVVLVKATTDTREVRSADLREDIWRLYNSDTDFVAVLNSCRIILNDVHCGFIDLKKKLSYWFRSETLRSWEWKTFRGSNWNLWIRKYFNDFLPAIFPTYKIGFYFRFLQHVGKRDAWHLPLSSQKSLFLSKDSARPDHFPLQNQELASYAVSFLVFHLSFSAGI